MDNQRILEGIEEFKKSVINDIEFYDSFLSVNESTINFVKKQILNSSFIKQKEHFNFFLKLLSKAPILRPKSAIFFNSILKELIPLISKMFTTFEISELFQSKDQILLLIEEKVIKVNNTYSRSMNDPSFFMFFYGDLKRKFSSFCQSKIDENEKIRNCLKNLDCEEFKKERKKYINQDEIAIAIRDDDFNSFIEKVYKIQKKDINHNSIDIQLINQNELNFNIQIDHSIIESNFPINNLQKMPTLIEYAAFYGSIKIFKFLFTKLSRNDLLTNSPNLAYYASIGGNVEIIQNLIDCNFEFDDKCQISSIEYHRYEASNLICQQPNFSTLFKSITFNNFKFFNDHLDVLKNDKIYGSEEFLRLFDYSFKNLPIYFMNFLFRIPKANECSLFSRIAKSCNIKVIKGAIENIDKDYLNINQNDKNGFNALHYACFNGSKEVVSFLLEQPTIDPNYASDAQNVKVKYFQMTPLHLVSMNKNIEICKLLLNHSKIEINKPIKKNNVTPLMTACMNDSSEIVDLLVNQKSININFVDNLGQNALHHAVASQSVESIKFLISHNIELNAKTKERLTTPFLLAVQNNELEIVRYFCSLNDNQFKLDFSAKDIFGI